MPFYKQKKKHISTSYDLTIDLMKVKSGHKGEF